MAVAVDDLDLFTDEVVRDPFPTYRALRDLGEVVHLAAHDVYALPRYAPVRKALEDWETFSSAQGVGLVDEYNQYFAGTMLASDPPEHDVLRSVLASRVSPRAIRSLQGDIARRAEALVDAVVQGAEFDAVTDLARAFPVSVVADLVGLPAEGRDRLLDYADRSFNVFGPKNARAQSSVAVFDEILAYISEVATPNKLEPGGMGISVYEAAERGEIRPDQVIPLMLAYLLPAMDTTVNAIASAVWLFAQHPEQWDIARSSTGAIAAAFEEVMRLESPIQGFSRVVTVDVVVGSTTIPAGKRVLLLYASANRDERKYESPDTFAVSRNPTDHVGFGFGVHGCPGQALARLEAKSVLGALATRVRRFEIIGPPERHLNNVVRGLAHLPVRIEA